MCSAAALQVQAHLDNFTRDVSLGASRRLEYLHTSGTFQPPAEVSPYSCLRFSHIPAHAAYTRNF